MPQECIGWIAEVEGMTDDLDAGLADDVAGVLLVALRVDQMALREVQHGAVGEELVEVGVWVAGRLARLVLGVDDGGRGSVQPPYEVELGILGRPGAFAEQVAIPETALHELPDQVNDVQGALVEPGGGALRAVRAAALQPGSRVLILGPGTIGVVAAMFARAKGAEVHLMGHADRSLPFAETLGFDGVWTADTLPDLPWDAVIDASYAPELPPKAVQLVEPGKRVVYIGLASAPSPVDSRELVLKDITAVGILGASAGLSGAIETYARGEVDPTPLVAATVPLEDLATALAGEFPATPGPARKSKSRSRAGRHGHDDRRSRSYTDALRSSRRSKS